MSWSESASLGSGLPDRFFLTVATSVIGHPYENNPSQAALVLTGESNVDGELSDEHLWLKAGENFEPGDKDGTFWVHSQQTPAVYDDPNGKPKKLNKNSGYGKFLKSFEESVGFAALEAAQDPSRNKYQIWDVKFWEGMVLDIEMVDEPYSFTNKQGELIEGSSRQPYVRGLSGGVDRAGGSTVGAAAATAAPAGSTNGSVDPKSFDSFISYLEAWVGAGGSSTDEKATKQYYESARS